MLKRIVVPVVIVLIAVVIFVAMKQTKPEKSSLAKPEKIWRVNTVSVTLQRLAPEITVYGRIETPKRATLRSALTADVIKVDAREGQWVNAGDPLVTLDDRDTQLIKAQRQSDLAEISALIESEHHRFTRDQNLLEHEIALLQLAQSAVDRAKKLQQSRLASQANLDEALANKERQMLTLKKLQHDIAEHPARLAQLQAQYHHAKALVAQADLDLARCRINAPFGGRIAQVNVAVADRVNNADPLLELYDTHGLEVRAQLPNRVIEQVRTMLDNQQTLTAQAMVQNQLLIFTLKRLSGEVRTDSGGIDGLFTLQDQSSPLELGTFVQLKMKLAPRDGLITLPFDALYGRNTVYVVRKGYLRAVVIERIGEIADNNIKQLLVTSEALHEGDLVVSTQLPNAMTGLKVEALRE